MTKNVRLNTPGDPRFGPSDFEPGRLVLTDEELDKRIKETEAIAALVKTEGWQLILGAMKLRADQHYRLLAVSRDWEEIRIAQCWLNLYNLIVTDMQLFLRREEGDKVEKRSRILKAKDKIVDFLISNNKKEKGVQ